MKRLLEFLQKLWGKAAVPALVLLLAVLIFPPMASAQYACQTHDCAPGYCPPSYGYSPTYAKSYGYRNQWSAWTYGAWGQDPSYFIFYRTFYDHCGTATNHNDGYLYSRYWHGGKWCYERHCLISAYAVKVPANRYIDPLGRTEVGYYQPEYEAARAFPYLVKPGVIQAQDTPRFLDPRSVLAPLADQSLARSAFVEKAVETTTSMALKIAAQDQANEAEKVRARGTLARQAQNDNTKLQILAKLNEIVATLDNKVSIDAEATPRAIINVGNPELARVIQDRCVSCHGPGKAEMGLNFASLAATDFKMWQKINRKVLTGQMPPDQPIDEEAELDLFDEQYQLALKAR